MKKSCCLLITMIFISLISAQRNTHFNKPLYSNSAKHPTAVNALGISLPIIWNNSAATFYRLVTRQAPNGKAVSYGLNINYSKTIQRNYYGTIGVGYFKQIFNITRPFNYINPTDLGFSTKSYNYKNIHLFAGIGNIVNISKEFYLNFGLLFNLFYSYQQEYLIPSNLPTQIITSSMELGKMINGSIGVEKFITKKISTGFNILIPIYVNWYDDEVFVKYDYSNDTQQIARNKLSLGSSLSLKYNF